MEDKAYAETMKVCKQFGEKEPNLWIHALSYFAKQDAEVNREIVDILHNIEKDDLLPPLVVVQILCEHSTATVAVVKEYLIRQLRRERQIIDQDQKMISQFRKEINTMQSEIEEINTSARIFQCVKCDACGAPVDLPAHHFLCMHSFHHRCLGENDRICPLCENDNIKVAEMNKALLQKADLHETFFKQLEGHRDGFTVISEYYGRGIFSQDNTTQAIQDREALLRKQGLIYN